MFPVLQVVDEAGTVLWDFNDPTGANNPFGARTDLRGEGFVLGGGRSDDTFFEPESLPGGTLVRRRDGLVESSWLQPIEADSYNDLYKARGELLRLLRSDDVALKWQATETSDVLHADIEAAQVGALLRGDGTGDIGVLAGSRDVAGLPIEITHQPHWRGALISSDGNILKNATLLIDADGNGRPDRWDWDSILNISAEAISAVDEAYQFDIATAAARQFQQTTGAGTAAQGNVWGFSFFVRAGAAGVVRAFPVIEYLDSANTSLVTHLGVRTDIGTTETRLFFRTPQAPVGTDRVLVSIRFENVDATQTTVFLRNAMLEGPNAPVAASLFRVGIEQITNDPEGFATQIGRAIPILIHGDAIAPVKLRLTGGDSIIRHYLFGQRGNDNKTGHRRLAQYLNSGKFRQLNSATVLDGETVSATEPNASGGTAMQTPFTNPSKLERLRIDLGADREALRGLFDVYVRVRTNAASTTIRLWLERSFGFGDVEFPAVTFAVDSTATGFDYVDLKLGTLSVLEDIDPLQIQLDLKAALDAGTGDLFWDVITLVPVDFTSIVEDENFNLSAGVLTADPENGRIFQVIGGGFVTAAVKSKGGVPIRLPPGLSIIYLHLGEIKLTGYEQFRSTLGISTLFEYEYEPRTFH